MYLNVNCTPSNNSGGGGGPENICTTPRTPEILNLLAGPFENYTTNYHTNATTGSNVGSNNASHSQHNNSHASQFPSRAGMPGGGLPSGAAATPGDGPNSPHEGAFSTSSSLSSPSTPSTPAGASIQHARTFLIKEGLKLTIQSKRLASGRGSFDLDMDPKHARHLDESPGSSGSNLTPEDEDRRRRRRERNKVAATKCRNRKKEKTVILLKEQDTLEDQNVGFRSEIQRLEAERRRLMDVLTLHSATCSRGVNANYAPPPVVTAMEPATVSVSYHHHHLVSASSSVCSASTSSMATPPTQTHMYNPPPPSDPNLQPIINTPCNNNAVPCANVPSGTYNNDPHLNYEAMYNAPRVPSYDNLGHCHQGYR